MDLNEIIDNSESNSASYAQNGNSRGITKDGLVYDTSNADSTINAINQQALWNREDLLRKAAEVREDTSMDRIVAAAKRNGINPIFLLDALGGNTVGNAASYTTSAAKANNYDVNARSEAANSAKIAGAIISALALILGAAIGA